MKPIFVAHTSPLTGAAADVEPIVRSAAGAIGSAANAVDEIPVPSAPPDGAVADRPSGRSRGENALRCAVSVQPAVSFDVTVTFSLTGGATAPATSPPKSSVGCPSAIPITDWICRRTDALANDDEPPPPPEHGDAGADEFSGAAATVEKSPVFESVSVQPPAARAIA